MINRWLPNGTPRMPKLDHVWHAVCVLARVEGGEQRCRAAATHVPMPSASSPPSFVAGPGTFGLRRDTLDELAGRTVSTPPRSAWRQKSAKRRTLTPRIFRHAQTLRPSAAASSADANRSPRPRP